MVVVVVVVVLVVGRYLDDGGEGGEDEGAGDGGKVFGISASVPHGREIDMNMDMAREGGVRSGQWCCVHGVCEKGLER